jgi:hypothetical protein
MLGCLGAVMSETRKTDQDRIDQTLSLFQNAIAETKTVLPPMQFGRAVRPKDVSPSEPPAQEKRAASLISQAVHFVRTVAGFVPKAAETVSFSLTPIVRIDEPKRVEATSLPSLSTAEAAVPSPRSPVGKPASKDVLPLERPTQESLIEQAHFFNKVAIFEQKAAEVALPSLQLPVAKQAPEKPVRLVDQALSMVATVPIDESKVFNVLEAVSPPSLNTAEAAVLSLRQSGDEPASKDMLPLERLTQDSLIGHELSLVSNVAISGHKAAEIASPSLQSPVAEQAKENHNGVGASSPPSLKTAKAAVPLLLRSVDEPASKDVLPLERPTQKEPPFLIGHAPSFVNKISISEHKAILVEKAGEKPVGDTRSDLLVDHALSMVAIVSIDEPKGAKSTSPPLLETAEVALLQQVDKPASKDGLPLARTAQEKPPSLICHAPSLVKVAIFENNTISVEKVTISEHKAAASPPSLNTAKATVFSLRQYIDEPVRKDVLHPIQGKSPSLIGHAPPLVNKVVEEVVISEHTATETASPSLQLPVAKQAWERPVGDAQSDRLVDQAQSVVAIVTIDEHKAIEAASSLPAPNTAKATRPSLRQPDEKPGSKDVLPLEHATEEEAPSLIGHGLSSVNVAISKHTTAETASPSLPLPVAERAKEISDFDARSGSLLDQALSMVVIVPIDEPKAVEAASPPSFNTAEAALLSPRQSVDKPASKDVLPLELPAQKEPHFLMGHAHSTVVAEAPTALETETAPQETLMKKFSPKERLDMDRADILKRVAIFRENQLRFQREREEYYATIMANIQATRSIPGTGIRDN